MWEFPDIKQNRTLYAQANSNLPIRIQTVEQLISRYSKQQRAAGCYYNRQQTRSSLAADKKKQGLENMQQLSTNKFQGVSELNTWLAPNYSRGPFGITNLFLI
jgi:hypothetical protein